MISVYSPDLVYEVPVFGMTEHQTNYHILDDDEAPPAVERVAEEPA